MMPIHWGATDGHAQPISRPDEVAQVCGELGGANGVLCGELKIGQVVVDQGTIHLSNVAMGETGTRRNNSRFAKRVFRDYFVCSGSSPRSLRDVGETREARNGLPLASVGSHAPIKYFGRVSYA